MVEPILFFNREKGLMNQDGEKISLEDWSRIKDTMEEISFSDKGHLEGEGYIYFIKGNNGLIKIGCTSNYKARLSNIKNKFKDCELYRVFKTDNMITAELMLHITFKKYRVTGEWFESNLDVLNYKPGEMESFLNMEEIEFG